MIRHAAGIFILVAILAFAGCMAVSQTGNFSADVQMIDTMEIPDDTAAPGTPTPTVQPSAAPTYTPAFTAEPTDEPTPAPTAEPTAETTPMATPEPTKSPELTKTPIPTLKYEVTDLEKKAAYLNAGSANFRKGPGLDYKIIDELKENAVFTVVGKSGDWLKVKYDGTYGFILAEFVEYGAPPTPTPKPTAKPTATPKPTKTPSPTVEPTKQPESNANGGVNSSDYFSSGGGFSADELLLVAQVVQEESKGSGVEARAAVANVIYNRIASSRFPDSVSGVIFQKNQFTVARDEDKLRAVVPVSKTIEAVNQIFVNGDRFMPEDVLYFRSSSKGTSWNKRVYYATFGGNSFFY
ncbi:MAG: cell wall hydrolase [Eubacteriales bacterium]|nr:cell wall hydrolase [Eubacteriales bacterium]